MSTPFPVSGLVYVLRGDDPFGPYEIEELLEGLETGEFSYDDICLREGAIDTERLRDLLDWEGELHGVDDEDRDGESDEPDWGIDESTHHGEQPESSLPQSAILYHGHRSIVTFPLAFIGLVGGVVGGIWLFPVDSAWTFGLLAISILSLGFLTLMRFTCEYIVRTGRVEQETGWLAKSSKEIRISDIRAINVTCRGLSGILGVGTVDFFTTGDEPEVRFRDVWGAKDVKKLVRKLQDS